MITAAAGTDVPLVFAAAAVLTSPMVTIAPTAGGAAVVGPTSAGLGVDGTTYTFVWQVSAAQAQASYTATLSGTSGGNPVEVEAEVYVTLLPVYADIDQFKERFPITDSGRDSVLVRNLAAASRSIDRTCGRRFWLDPSPVARIINPRRSVTRERTAGIC